MKYKRDSGDCVLVNPGSLMRMKTDQAKVVPTVYMYDTDTNAIKKLTVPYDEDVFAEGKKKLGTVETSFDDFVESLNGGLTTDLSFEKNMEAFLSQNKVAPVVSQLVWEIIEATR